MFSYVGHIFTSSGSVSNRKSLKHVMHGRMGELMPHSEHVNTHLEQISCDGPLVSRDSYP